MCECLPGYYGAPPNCHPECTTNPDCPKYLACVNEDCVDPCVGTCGVSADCQVVNHNPTCTCPRGYQGDPYIQCRLVECKIYFVFALSAITLSNEVTKLEVASSIQEKHCAEILSYIHIPWCFKSTDSVVRPMAKIKQTKLITGLFPCGVVCDYIN